MAVNKTELLTDVADTRSVEDTERALLERGCEVHRISSSTGQGVSELVVSMLRCIDEATA